MYNELISILIVKISYNAFYKAGIDLKKDNFYKIIYYLIYLFTALTILKEFQLIDSSLFDYNKSRIYNSFVTLPSFIIGGSHVFSILLYSILTCIYIMLFMKNPIGYLILLGEYVVYINRIINKFLKLIKKDKIKSFYFIFKKYSNK